MRQIVTGSKNENMTRKKIALLLIIVVVLGVGIYYVTRVHKISIKDTAFQISGTRYSKTEISAMAGYAAQQGGLSKSQEAKMIFEFYKTEVAAQKLGIVPTSSELQTEAKALSFSKSANVTDQQYINLVKFNNALVNETYRRYTQGNYQGDLLVFDFSERILPPSPYNIAPVAGQGNQSLIQQDKKYADQQARAYYTAYKKDPNSLKSLNSQLQAKKKTGFHGEALSFQSSPTSDLLTQLSFYGDAYSYVTSQVKPGLSTVRVGKEPTKLNPSSSDYVDGYYYFVNLRQVRPAIKNPNGEVVAQEKKLQAAYYGL
jgi:hypothetical protein